MQQMMSDQDRAVGKASGVGLRRASGSERSAKGGRRGFRVSRAFAWIAAAVGLILGGAAIAAPAQAATATNRLANAYGYVSDAGTAVISIPFRSGTGLTYDGTVWFWTSPGVAAGAVDFNDVGAVVRSTTGSEGQTLPAFAGTADGSAEQIGTWTIPTGAVFDSSAQAQKQITLQLDAEHVDYAGPIRPIKVSLTDTAHQSYLNTYYYTGTGTMYAFALATTNDATFPITSADGTVPTDYTVGSCMNTTSSPSQYLSEIYNNTCSNHTVSLVDSDGNSVTSLDMLDTAGNVIGTWNSDGTTITWSATSPTAVLGIRPVDYTVKDTRTGGWSGWWDQSVTAEANTLGGAASYDVATLTPTTTVTPASAEDASESTDPGVSVTLSPEYGAGAFVFGDDAAISQVSVEPADDAQGSWVVNADGTFTFTPADGVAGVTASAVYTVVSSNGTSASANLTVTIAEASVTPVTPTPVPSDPVTPVPSDSPTPVPSDPVTPVPSDSPTPVPSDPVTPVPSDSPTPVPSDPVTPVPSDSPTPVPSDPVTPVPSDSPTPTPSSSATPTPSPTTSAVASDVPSAASLATTGGGVSAAAIVVAAILLLLGLVLVILRRRRA